METKTAEKVAKEAEYTQADNATPDSVKKLLASLEAIEAKIAELKKEATPEELKEVEHYLAVAKELERVKGVENKIEKLGKKDPVFREILEKNPELLTQLDEDAEYLDELVKNDEEFKDLVLENKIKNSVDENSLLLLEKRPELKELILENPEFIKSKPWVDSLGRLAKKERVKDVELKIQELGKKDPVFEELFKEEPALVEEFKKNPELFNEYLKDINNGLKEEEEKILAEIKEKFSFEDAVIENIRDFLQKRPEFKELISKNEDLIKSKHWVKSLRKLAEKEN
ncbi:hypothetical protein MCFN_02730 [Mycoplasmopsis californica]|uniref:Uncharacterized protein n=1 Tax=Mycoplasmopsis californica TaxID=2113 RepID=A0A059XMC2_9BACT|nr:hypothetical protein [Mycoplasmopsis californica]AIA29664.1 hypothetical protein MCFN_02730 [Mycoplasmopsis californica]